MDIVTLSSKGQIVIPAKVRKKFSLKEGDSLVIVEEKDGIRLQPLVNLPELWGVDKLKDTKSILREIRKEWDDELKKHGCSLIRTHSSHFSTARMDQKSSGTTGMRSRTEMRKDSLQR